MIDTMRNPGVHAEPVHPWVAEGHGSVRFGIVGGPRGDWPALSDFVRMVEELGFDSFRSEPEKLTDSSGRTHSTPVCASSWFIRPSEFIPCVSTTITALSAPATDKILFGSGSVRMMNTSR